MIDVDLQLAVADRRRHFELAVRFASDAPVLALFGPSGAGKSLTLQAIAGLIQPQGGHVRIGGRTLFDARARVDLPAAQRRVGYLFQDYALFPHLSVQENVGFGLTSWRRRRLRPADAQRVAELLETFGLTGLAQARPGALSGGQRQRVALARALACEPELLLLDEPFAALNPLLRQSLRQELALVRERWRIPMLLITHDVEDVLALADVACVLEQGRVVREVDVHRGIGRELLHSGLGLRPPPVEDDRTRAVRQLLAQAGGG
ncbi:ABC transporter ATP-binding protein [Ideonella sp. B508-1]|uniref:ABC transporter ATP-binding protein n=1 Tax=Ideonella sp. B508-1 TaxID=137716 RepID=UPI0003496B01|nr:ATP-binding cassette domain-containing protein [Ideonella sp. B508-1]